MKITRSTMKKSFYLCAQWYPKAPTQKIVKLPCYKKATREHPLWRESVRKELQALAVELSVSGSPVVYSIHPTSQYFDVE
jgi:hypothetical protein